jgi:signal transduction histidine kinase
MRLADFIRTHMEPILAEWEAFAATIVPPALTMDSTALRDHARLMLDAIAADLETTQTDRAQQQKSHGAAPLQAVETAAEVHASARLMSGFSIEQVFAEYRALRASVLRLWSKNADAGLLTNPDDVTRFNEGIDQAIAESVARYAKLVSNSQNLFLAILAHDLRNPLATTIMASSLIMQAPGIDGKFTLAANRIHSAGKRMNRLVNDLIDYTRTHLGQDLPVMLREADLRLICVDVVEEHRLAHPQRQFHLEADGNYHGHWDDNRIAQVVSNLLGNAVQYGDRHAPILVRITATPDRVLLAVENQGPVIPPEQAAALFRPLVRFAESEHISDLPDTSLGIGLYIAKEIVRAHAGTISVTSTAGTGTVFAVDLPRNAHAAAGNTHRPDGVRPYPMHS